VLARRYPGSRAALPGCGWPPGHPDIIATRRWRDRWPAVDQGPVLSDPAPAN